MHSENENIKKSNILCKTLKNKQIFRIHTLNYIIYSIHMI